ncbi:RICIN domain-containing protein [Streptomyces sp. NPDC020731]|uniref:RICIN domain-containing protein n=1 Tax=Streptomyces sp. NPDC020731 TaxID=3365085 RepID=UPI0037979B1E
MRALKDQSDLTLRELESRAAAHGDVLARSTVADMLRRPTLPRAEQVAAFVRACGDQDRLAEWMHAYERLACGVAVTDPAPSQESGRNASPSDPPVLGPGGEHAATTRLRIRPLIAVVALGLAGAAGAGVLLAASPAGNPTTQPRTTATASARLPDLLPLASAGSWARIRRAQFPELCVTAGSERSRRYPSEVAVQRPCAEPGGPRTFFQPVGDDLTNIKWEHPVDKGMGCLTILDSGPVAGLVEPWDECRPDMDAQLFRIERFGPEADGYRLRRAHTDHCLGIRDGEATSGAEAVQQPCGDEPSQRFLIDVHPRASASR